MPRKQKIIKTCLACQRPFEVWPCKAWRKYCGRPCSLGKQGKKKPAFRWLFNKVRYEAAKAGRTFTLTFRDFLRFTRITKCHYCRAKILWTPHAGRSRCYFLDRKNNNRGYEKTNCVVCCSRCNRAKSKYFTYREWVLIGKVIQRFGKKRR
jgi:hypothetical protein